MNVDNTTVRQGRRKPIHRHGAYGDVSSYSFEERWRRKVYLQELRASRGSTFTPLSELPPMRAAMLIRNANRIMRRCRDQPYLNRTAVRPRARARSRSTRVVRSVTKVAASSTGGDGDPEPEPRRRHLSSEVAQ